MTKLKKTTGSQDGTKLLPFRQLIIMQKKGERNTCVSCSICKKIRVGRSLLHYLRVVFEYFLPFLKSLFPQGSMSIHTSEHFLYEFNQAVLKPSRQKAKVIINILNCTETLHFTMETTRIRQRKHALHSNMIHTIFNSTVSHFSSAPLINC